MTENKNLNSTVITNPFKGPTSYEEVDALYFYGREAEKNDLINLIAQNTLTLLYSRSGVGKSSLINAGLIPILKESIFYFPVYIRLSDTMIKDDIKTFSQAIIRIIKNEAQNRKVKIKKNETFNVSLSENPSLTEFLYFSEFEFKVDEETLIKVVPVIIFDQFEEIFSRYFQKANIKDLIEDLSFVIESRIPDRSDKAVIFGKELFRNLNEEESENEINKLKSRLKQVLKDYRFIFSFRDEYLPRFESLMNKLPSIFKMSGRLNLQTFSISQAAGVINMISKKSIEIDEKFSRHLARSISNLDKKFESEYFNITEEVQPFLLSLVCRNIYPKIVGDNKDKNVIDAIEKEESGVIDQIVSDYTEEIFSKISDKTRKFIEEELITENERRKLFVLGDVKDEEIKKELNDLSKEQELRYLNIVQYFNSSNVEILHDRLLRPLVESRKERREKEYNDLLAEQKKKFDEENKIAEAKRQKEIDEQKQKIEDENKRARKKRKYVALAILFSWILAVILNVVSLNNIKNFVLIENEKNIERYAKEIPKSSIPALIKMFDYKGEINKIGDNKWLPDIVIDVIGFISTKAASLVEPLQEVQKNLNEDVRNKFENIPLFITIKDSMKVNFRISPKCNFKCIIEHGNLNKDEDDSLNSIYTIFQLQNSSIPQYSDTIATFSGKTLTLPTEPFSQDEKYFIVNNSNYFLIYNLQTDNDKVKTPVDSILMIENYRFIRFSADSKSLIFKKEDDKGKEYLIKEIGGNSKSFKIPDDESFYTALSYNSNFVYCTVKKKYNAIIYSFTDMDSETLLKEVMGNAANRFINGNTFVTILNDSVNILDLNTFQMNAIHTSINKPIYLDKNSNKIIIGNDSGAIQIFQVGINQSEPPVNLKYILNSDASRDINPYFFLGGKYFSNMEAYLNNENENKVLINYHGNISLFDLSKNENEPGYKFIFGYFLKDLKYAKFNDDLTVNLIDIQGNIIKWYYEMNEPKKLQSYFEELKKVYGNSLKGLQNTADVLGLDSLNKIRLGLEQ